MQFDPKPVTIPRNDLNKYFNSSYGMCDSTDVDICTSNVLNNTCNADTFHFKHIISGDVVMLWSFIEYL